LIFDLYKKHKYKIKFYFFFIPINILYFLNKNINELLIDIGDWGLGIGDWGLGIGDWGLGPIPTPPIPNPHSKNDI